MAIRMNQDNETRAKTGRQPILPPYGLNSTMKRRRDERANLQEFLQDIEDASKPPYLSPITTKLIDEIYNDRSKPAIINQSFLNFSQPQKEFLDQLTKVSQLDEPSAPFTSGEQKQNCLEAPANVRADVSAKIQLTCAWPNQPDVLQLRFGYGLIVEETRFRAFHYDLEEDFDCLLSLTNGKKLWIIALPGHSAGVNLERFAGDNESHRGFTDFVKCLRGLSKAVSKRIFWGWLVPGKTLYLPATSMHAVISVKSDNACISMFSFEIETEEERRYRNRRKAFGSCKAAMARQKALSGN